MDAPGVIMEPATNFQRAIDDYVHADSFKPNPNGLYYRMVRDVERYLFERVIKRAKGNRCKAAEILGINRNTLRKKCEQYRIEIEDKYSDRW